MSESSDYKDRLLAAMQAVGVDEKQLAAALGVTQQAVRKVVKTAQTKALSAPNNAHAAARLGVSADWLATGEGPMRPISERARQLARLLDQLGDEDSPVFLAAWADVRQVLDMHQAGQRPVLTPRPQPSSIPAPEPRTEKRVG